MQIIPTQAVPSQTFQVNLANQVCQINIYQKPSGLYMDVICATMVNGGLWGVLCENLNRIVRSLYLGFSGDFIWIDGQGETDPVFESLGSRYSLAYLAASDLAEIGLAA
jgi:hypothetical protein